MTNKNMGLRTLSDKISRLLVSGLMLVCIFSAAPQNHAPRPGGDSRERIAPDSLYKRYSTTVRRRAAGALELIPVFKSVETTGGVFKGDSPVKTKILKNVVPEFYRISLSPKGATIEGGSPEAVARAERILETRLLPEAGGVLPCAVIEDWPDAPRRGLVLEVSGDVPSPGYLRNLIRLMADYRLNRLVLRLGGGEDVQTYMSSSGYTEVVAAGDSLDVKVRVENGTGGGWPDYRDNDFVGMYCYGDYLETGSGERETLEESLFPALLETAERGWNSSATRLPTFTRIMGDKELPRLTSLGINWTLESPGIQVESVPYGIRIMMNAPYQDALIHYTLDGTEPDLSSPLYTGPLRLPEGTYRIRAITYKDGHLSLPSSLDP